LVALVVYLSFEPSPATSLGGDKTGHLLAYLTLVLWFAQWTPRRRHVALLGRFALMGAVIEVLQPLVGRSFDGWDVAANLAGAIVGAVLAAGPLGQVLARWEAARATRGVRG
jgi:VanZ family protein